MRSVCEHVCVREREIETETERALMCEQKTEMSRQIDRLKQPDTQINREGRGRERGRETERVRERKKRGRERNKAVGV